MRRLPLLVALAAGCDRDVAEPYDFTLIDGRATDGAATEVYDDAAARARREVFWFGGGEHTPVSDYVFVIDPSISMANVLERFQRGFAQLGDGNPFPAKARIAVTYAIPADPAHPGQLHPGVRRTPGAQYSPGFRALIDAERIANYRERAKEPVAGLFEHDGCAAWFDPMARNGQGVPCIVAHTQLPLVGIGPEAGLLAAAQMLDRPGRLFRPGAAANLVFVSDTHDPGLPRKSDPEAFDDLMKRRPDWASLVERVNNEEVVASFKVHAIAPKFECSEPWKAEIGPAYFQVAEASGGVVRDICTTEDYGDFIRDIASDGSVVRNAVFPLSTDASAVESVLIDGKAQPFTVRANRVVAVDTPVGDHPKAVEVTYRYDKPDRPTLQRRQPTLAPPPPPALLHGAPERTPMQVGDR